MRTANKLVLLQVVFVALIGLPASAAADVSVFNPDNAIVRDNAVAVDGAGMVYVYDDSYLGSVKKFDAEGRFVGTPLANAGSAYRFTVDRSGTIYLPQSSGAGGSRIDKFDPSGALVGSIASPPSGSPGQFLYVRGLTVDGDGNVYVLPNNGSTSATVAKFSASGAFLAEWGAYGSGDAQFLWPKSIATDDAGRVYVADLEARVQVFDGDGSFLRSWPAGSRGTIGSFPPYQNSIAVSPGGSVYVGDPGAQRVQKFDSTGRPLGEFRGGAAGGDLGAGAAEGVAVAPSSGLLYVTRSAQQIVRVEETIPMLPQLAVRPSPATPGEEVTVDASSAFLPFGSIDRYEFDLDGDGEFEQNRTSPIATTTYPREGVVTIRARVTGSRGVAAQGPPFELAVGDPEPAGITIEDGKPWVNRARVQVQVVAPAGATSIFLSSTADFAGARSQPLAPSVAWTLDKTAPEKAPQTLHARFGSAPTIYQDAIGLDRTRPRILAASVSAAPASATAARRPRRTIRVRARDNASGVTKMQLTTSRKRPGELRAYRRKVVIRTARGVRVRVQDAAGNSSPWTKAVPR